MSEASQSFVPTRCLSMFHENRNGSFSTSESDSFKNEQPLKEKDEKWKQEFELD